MNDEQLLARVFEARGQLLDIANELRRRMKLADLVDVNDAIQAK